MNFKEFIKCLGIFVDSNMKGVSHIDYLSKKLHSVIFTLNALKRHADNATSKIVFCSNFQSLLIYGIVFWVNSSNARKIFKDHA